MDSRNSPSSTAAANCDGSSSADDVNVLSVTAALAKEAALLFQSCKFADCVDVQNQLLQKKEDDPKVIHNIAIAEYFRDGCSDPKKLLEVLNSVREPLPLNILCLLLYGLNKESGEHGETFSS